MGLEKAYEGHRSTAERKAVARRKAALRCHLELGSLCTTKAFWAHPFADDRNLPLEDLFDVSELCARLIGPRSLRSVWCSCKKLGREQSRGLP